MPASRHPLLTRLDDRAAKAGWRCLSNVWQGYHTRYAFECRQGHRFDRLASVFLYRDQQSRCEMCEQEAIRERWMAGVAARGGTLLNGPFTGLSERYRLRCDQGHEWETSGNLISRGKWCPQCAHTESAQRNRLADGLARLQSVAAGHGGRCLATEYTRSSDAYPFECALGHRWTASGSMMAQGNWCPTCAAIGRRLTLEDMQALAAKHGGLCLSTEYRAAHEKLIWQCRRGHVWQAIVSNVKYNGRWCPNCARLDGTKDRVKRLRYDYEG